MTDILNKSLKLLFKTSPREQERRARERGLGGRGERQKRIKCHITYFLHTVQKPNYGWNRIFSFEAIDYWSSRLIIRNYWSSRLIICKFWLPLWTLRPRLLYSFRGSIMLRCFGKNSREFVSRSLDRTENISIQFLKNSSLSNNSVPSLCGVWAAKEWNK